MEKAPFIDIEDLQKSIAISLTSSEQIIEPYIVQAFNKFVKPILGSAYYDYCLQYTSTRQGSGFSEDVLFHPLYLHTQNALAQFAYHLALSVLNVNIGDSGITVTSTAHLAPASKHRTDELKQDLLSAGWDAMNELVLYYLDNRAALIVHDVPVPQMIEYDKLIVRSAYEFSQYVNIDHSALYFFNNYQKMFMSQALLLIGILGEDMYNDLLISIGGGESEQEYNMMFQMYCQGTICLKFAAENIDPSYQSNYDNILSYFKKYLYANADSFPLFKESEVFEDDKTDYNLYENLEDNNLYVF